MGSWPGDAPLEGTIDGDRFSFTATGKSPWKSGSSLGQSSGLPKLTFTGSVHANVMELTVLWDNVMLYGPPPPPRHYEMKTR